MLDIVLMSLPTHQIVLDLNSKFWSPTLKITHSLTKLKRFIRKFGFGPIMHPLIMEKRPLNGFNRKIFHSPKTRIRSTYSKGNQRFFGLIVPKDVWRRREAQNVEQLINRIHCMCTKNVFQRMMSEHNWGWLETVVSLH